MLQLINIHILIIVILVELLCCGDGILKIDGDLVLVVVVYHVVVLLDLLPIIIMLIL